MTEQSQKPEDQKSLPTVASGSNQKFEFWKSFFGNLKRSEKEKVESLTQSEKVIATFRKINAKSENDAIELELEKARENVKGLYEDTRESRDPEGMLISMFK